MMGRRRRRKKKKKEEEEKEEEEEEEKKKKKRENGRFLRVFGFGLEFQNLQGSEQSEGGFFQRFLSDINPLFAFHFADDIAQNLPSEMNAQVNSGPSSFIHTFSIKNIEDSLCESWTVPRLSAHSIN